MPDGQTDGLQRVQNDVSTIPSSTPPPPGAPPMPLQGKTESVTQGAPPPDYTALGAGQAKADFASASASGGWDFDPVAIDKVIKQLEDSLDRDYAEAKRQSVNLLQITAPGSEIGSTGYVESASASGASYNKFLKGATDFISAYVETLKQIQTAYANNDESTKEQLRNVGKAE